MPRQNKQSRKEYRTKYNREHKKERAAYAKLYRKTHPDDKVRQRKYTKRRREKVKDTVFSHYGNKCACCSEEEKEFLCVDHINNDGKNHRKVEGIGGGHTLHEWLIKHNFPEGFQLLCWNCNMSKHFGKGVCVHNRKDGSDAHEMDLLTALLREDGK